MHALIVDDNPMIQRVLAPCFKAAGRRCTLVKSCKEAEMALADERFDLAVLDIHLPDGTGIDVAAALRQRYPEPVIPIVFMSSEATAGALVHRLGLSNCCFCDKLDGTGALRETVDTACEIVESALRAE